MTRFTITVALMLVALYVAMCAALYFKQRSFIYYPTPKGDAGSGVKVVDLPVDGASLRVLVLNHGAADAVIYFGGNAEDVGYSATDLAQAFPDRAVYLLHYRGYGGSSGEPSERALVADGLALFDWVHQRHKRVRAIGRSLGSGIAVQVASQRPVERLVLVTPYDSIAEMAASQFPYFPVRWLLEDKFESWRFAPKVSAATTIIAASDDAVIPRARTERLFASFPRGRATLRVIAGAGHNSVSDDAAYARLLRE